MHLASLPTWRKAETVSLSPSVVSIPTRGWASPGGSVFSETPSTTQSGYPPLTGISKSPLYFLCYQVGNFLADCPRLSGNLQKEASGNRAAYLRSQDVKNRQIHQAADRATRFGDYNHRLPPTTAPVRRGGSGVFELTVPDSESAMDEQEILKNDDNPQHGSKNFEGGN
jgi:hypothetical protein